MLLINSRLVTALANSLFNVGLGEHLLPTIDGQYFSHHNTYALQITFLHVCRYPSIRLGLKGNRSCYTSAYN